jgi:hypothetical protein
MESKKQILEELQFVFDLSKSDLSVKEQEEFFMNVCKKSRATFYRDRKVIGVNSQKRNFEYAMMKRKKCYFCEKKSQLIHHINQNKKDNNPKNIIPLCRSCHNKIHRVLVNCRKVAQVSSMKNDISTKKNIELKGGVKNGTNYKKYRLG